MSVIALTHGTLSWGEDTLHIQNLIDEGRKVRPLCNTFENVVKKYSENNPAPLAEVIHLVDRYPGFPRSSFQLLDEMEDDNLSAAQFALANTAEQCAPIPLFDFEKAAISAAANSGLNREQKESLNLAILHRARNELNGTRPLIPILLEISILNQLAHSDIGMFLPSEIAELEGIDLEGSRVRTEIQPFSRGLTLASRESFRAEIAAAQPLRKKLMEVINQVCERMASVHP